MTPAILEVRPKVSASVNQINSSGRTVPIRKMMGGEVGVGKDTMSYWYGSQALSGTVQRIYPGVSEATRSVLLLGAPGVSVAASSPLTSKDYRVTLERLRALKQDDDEEDRPSEYAYQRTVRLLRDTADNLGMQFPPAMAVTGPNKCIRLLWTRSDREIRVTVGGSEANKSYLYWRESGRSGIEPTLDGRTLHRHLGWLALVR